MLSRKKKLQENCFILIFLNEFLFIKPSTQVFRCLTITAENYTFSQNINNMEMNIPVKQMPLQRLLMYKYLKKNDPHDWSRFQFQPIFTSCSLSYERHKLIILPYNGTMFSQIKQNLFFSLALGFLFSI